MGKKDISRSVIAAPLSTAVLIPKAWNESDPSVFPERIPSISNIPTGSNWTEIVEPGSIMIVQQPKNHKSAIIGDIIATRLRHRGVSGVIVDGRIRDIKSCTTICDESPFQIWSAGISAVGFSIEAKPWAVNIALQIGDVWVKPGDIVVADEIDEALVVIPKEQLQAVYELLPVQKAAADGVLDLVRNGSTLSDAVKKHPDFYSNHK